MPKTKQRLATATIVTKNALEQAGVSLQELAEKPKASWSLREAVIFLQDAVTTALNRGYSYDEIVKILAANKIPITASSLKRYLSAARQERRESAERKVKQSRKSATTAKPGKTKASAAQTTAKRRTKSKTR